MRLAWQQMEKGNSTEREIETREGESNTEKNKQNKQHRPHFTNLMAGKKYKHWAVWYNNQTENAFLINRKITDGIIPLEHV